MAPSVLLISDRGDVGAVALAAHLRRRGTCRVTHVDHLAFARSPLTHHPESGWPPPADGVARCAAARSGSTRVDRSPLDADFDAIVCRSITLGARPFERKADAEYAAAEMHALGLSWLWARRDVLVNLPAPVSLCGTTPDLLRTAMACAEVGLSTPDLLLAADAAGVAHRRRPPDAVRVSLEHGLPGDLDLLPPVGDAPPLAAPAAWVTTVGPERMQVLVCGDEAVGAPAGLREPLLALTRHLGLAVAEIRLALAADGSGRPEVVGVTPVPALTGSGQVRVLADHVELRASERARRAAA